MILVCFHVYSLQLTCAVQGDCCDTEVFIVEALNMQCIYASFYVHLVNIQNNCTKNLERKKLILKSNKI